MILTKSENRALNRTIKEVRESVTEASNPEAFRLLGVIDVLQASRTSLFNAFRLLRESQCPSEETIEIPADAVTLSNGERLPSIHALQRVKDRYGIELTLPQLSDLGHKLTGKRAQLSADFRLIAKTRDGLRKWQANLRCVGGPDVWVNVLHNPACSRVITFYPRDHIMKNSGSLMLAPEGVSS